MAKVKKIKKIKKMDTNKIQKVDVLELGYIVNNHTYVPNVRRGGQQDADEADIEHMMAVEEWLDTDGNEAFTPPTALELQGRGYLNDTDWYVIRFLELGTPIPQEVLDARALAKIDALKGHQPYIKADVLNPIDDVEIDII